MSQEGKDRPASDVSPEPEDIEILEVVGLEEDTSLEPEEVEVVFDPHENAQREPAICPVRAPREEQDTRERLIRLQADFENLKKRVERERDDYYRYATSTLMARLLPIVDNLERALVAPDAGSADRAFRDGVALIQRQLLDELRQEGLCAVESLGRPFDPCVHEAVETVALPDHPPNTVVEEFRRGYYFHDRLLRPALVRVTLDSGGGERRGEDREEH